MNMNRIANLDELLTLENINESIIALDNFICELCSWGDNLENLTDSQLVFYFNQNLEREVNNGGLIQFFTNSSGDFTHETINSLKLIHAEHTASILQLAIDQFPNKSVPANTSERIVLVEHIIETAMEKWDVLDQKFYEYKDDLNALNIEYVRRNRTEF